MTCPSHSLNHLVLPLPPSSSPLARQTTSPGTHHPGATCLSTWIEGPAPSVRFDQVNCQKTSESFLVLPQTTYQASKSFFPSSATSDASQRSVTCTRRTTKPTFTAVTSTRDHQSPNQLFHASPPVVTDLHLTTTTPTTTYYNNKDKSGEPWLREQESPR